MLDTTTHTTPSDPAADMPELDLAPEIVEHARGGVSNVESALDSDDGVSNVESTSDSEEEPSGSLPEPELVPSAAAPPDDDGSGASEDPAAKPHSLARVPKWSDEEEERALPPRTASAQDARASAEPEPTQSIAPYQGDPGVAAVGGNPVHTNEPLSRASESGSTQCVADDLTAALYLHDTRIQQLEDVLERFQMLLDQGLGRLDGDVHRILNQQRADKGALVRHANLLNVLAKELDIDPASAQPPVNRGGGPPFGGGFNSRAMTDAYQWQQQRPRGRGGGRRGGN